MKMDFKKFKKVKSDKDSIVMEHPDGHTITVALKALHPKMREQLHALPLAKGGEPENPKLEESKKQPPKPKMMADGGDPAEAPSEMPEGPTGPDAPVVDQPINLDLNPTPPSSGPLGPKEGSEEAAMAASPMIAAAPQQEMAPARQPAGVPPQAAASPDLMHGYQEAQAGLMQGAKAEGALGREQAKELEAGIAQQKELQDHFMKSYNDLNEERINFMDDIKNNMIDPNKYWDDHSKVAAGIGIILAGFNPTGRPNAALEFLNHQIDRSIQAQMANMNSRNNLLAANMHQFGNMKDAMAMTRVMQSDILANQLKAAAAKATDPLAKARALQAAGQLEMQVVPQMLQLNMRQALIKAGRDQQGGGAEEMLPLLRVMAPEQAKEMESRMLPGVDGHKAEFASIPIPEKEREKMIIHQQLGNAARDLEGWVKQHGGTVDPKTVAEGKAKAMALQSKVREALLNTVYREGEQPLLDQLVKSDPTAFLGNIRVLPGLHQIIQNNDRDYNTLRKNYGLPEVNPMDRLSPQQRNFVEWAHKNPKDPRSAMILQKLGMQ